MRISVFFVLVLLPGWGVLAQEDGARQPLSAENADQITERAALDQFEGFLVEAIALSPDGKWLATAVADSTVKLWDMRTGEIVREIEVEQGAGSLAFSPDSAVLAIGAHLDGPTLLVDVLSGETLHTLLVTDRRWSTHDLLFSADGRLLLAADNTSLLRFWDVAGGQLAATYTVEGGYNVNTVDWSPDGRLLVVGKNDGMLQIVDQTLGINLFNCESPTASVYNTINSVAFSPDGTEIAAGDSDGMLRFWDAATGTLIREYAAESAVKKLIYAPDGSFLALAAGSPEIQLIDPETGEEIASLAGHRDNLVALALSPDGTLLASTAWDRGVRIWGVGETPLFAAADPPAAEPTEEVPAQSTGSTTASDPGDCTVICDAGADALDLQMSCESGQFTTTVNNSTNVAYEGSTTIYTLLVNEKRTYTTTGNTYDISGTLVFKQTGSVTALESYVMTVKGGVFGENATTCSSE